MSNSIYEILEQSEFPADYINLADANELENVFSSKDWFNNFSRTIIEPEEKVIWIGCKTAEGVPLLLLPLWQKSRGNGLTAKISSLSNYYTTLYAPLHCITDPEQLEQAIDLAVTGVCQLKWDVIDIFPLNDKSSIFALLIKAFRRHSKQVSPYFLYGNWFYLIQGKSFQEYYQERPSQLKNTIKRRSNKLKQKQVRYQLCLTPEETPAAVAHFQENYKTSWKQDEPYPEFIRGLARIAAQNGWLRLGLLFIDEQVAAAQLWLTVHKTAYIYKLTQNPAFDSFSPGSILTTNLMEYVIDTDKVTKIDFLTGDDPYKKDWMSHREERWGLQISNPKTVFGLLQAGKNILAAQLKQLKKALNR